MVNPAFPWTAGGLTITRAALRAVEQDALAGYARGEEACGYLAGPASEPLLCDEHVRMENRANELHEKFPDEFPRTGRTFFYFNSLQLDRAVERGAAAGRPVKVFYHSHLDVGAYFSETDAAAMTAMGGAPTWPVAYLVTSVRGGAVDDHKLFVWDGAGFVASTFSIINE